MLNGTADTRKPASYARSSVKVKEAGGENTGTEGSADLSETGVPLCLHLIGRSIVT